MDPKEELAVSEILEAARIPRIELDCRTQSNVQGKVVKLRFAPCLGLEEIPRVIGNLSSLEEIYLFWASRRLTHLPSDGFDRLHNLRVLQIRWCRGLRELPKLSNGLEELYIEGCCDITDLSSLRTAKRTWKKLRCLHIVEIGARGVCSLIEALSTEGEDKERGDQPIESNCSEEPSSWNSPSTMFFPSLTSISLRNNSIDQADVAKLWPFFRQCPLLIRIDLRKNNISSFREIVEVATGSGSSQSETQTATPHMALRELNLTENPVCDCNFDIRSSKNVGKNHNLGVENHQDAVDASGENDTDGAVGNGDIHSALLGETEGIRRNAPCHTQQCDCDEKNLFSLITANPQLVSIVACSSKCQNNMNNVNSSNSGNQSRCDCFHHSGLYSARIRHALDLNQCTKGMRFMQTMPTTERHQRGICSSSSIISLCHWPLLLNRVNQLSSFTPRIDDKANPRQHCRCEGLQQSSNESSRDADSQIGRDLRERQASVIFSLLQGPVFAARGNP